MVLVVSDTFRRDHAGAYGNAGIRTPNLDRLAAESVVFDHHVVSSFPTMPARADLLTGRFAYTFMGWEPLPAGLETLPGLLSAAGYLTMGVVDTPFLVRNGYGYDRGFDDFIWVRGQGDDTRPHERSDARLTWVSEADRLVARTMTAAEGWLERHYREPFFLYVDTWDPHEPWDAPDYYAALYKPDYDGRHIYPCYGKWREHGLTEEDMETVRATYCGEVTMVDRWLGRLLEKLDVLGLRDRTYVFFTSDHGFFFGEHDYFGKAEWFHDPGAVVAAGADVPEWLPESWLLTIGWSPLYQELTRVPLIVRGPGLEPGRRTALTTAPDIPSTILDLAGAAPAAAMDGRSFRDVLADGGDEHRPFVISSWPLYFAEGEMTSAVDSRPRRIASYMPLTATTQTRSLILGGADEEPELYDLDADPRESVNLWRDRSDEGLQLAAEAVAFLEEHGTPERYLEPRRSALRGFTRS
ncbi:MAG TPA: sulfatase [Gaiellaceae bacterium]|nr:sulfatase [Gaiellaceae bacterium]